MNRSLAMNKKYLLIITAMMFLIFSPTPAAANLTSDYSHPASTFEGGHLYKSGKLNVLDLRGTYRQMGRQYGYLLKDQLNYLYRIAIEEYFIDKKNYPLKR